MPISLHDFSQNFVIESTRLTAFGRPCSMVGCSHGKHGSHGLNLRKAGAEPSKNQQKTRLKFFRVFRAFREKNPLFSKP